MPRRNVNAVRRRQAAVANDTTATTGYTQLRDPHHRQQQRSYLPSDQWAPGISTAFQILISLRLSAAIWSPISDCDEVYNYWEPLHFLLYGNGFQTWEYSPVYAIRSYAYVGLHYLPARLFQLFLPNTKVTTFFFVRCLLAFICACSDILFYSSVCRKFGNGVGRLTFCFQALGAGFFVSSAAFLPSSFAMVMTTFAFAFWMRSNDWAAVLCIAISALVGWPFAALLGAPIAIDMLLFPSAGASTSKKTSAAWSRRKLFFMHSFVIGAAIVGALLFIDSAFYGKLTLAPFNIVRYNIFTAHGPDLYGVAPLSYYIVNLFLNWNVAAVLSCVALPFTAAVFYRYYGLNFWRTSYRQWLPVIFVQLAYWLWFGIFFRQPHKEERFLYPAYSLLCLSAALTLDSYERIASSSWWVRRSYERLRSLLIDIPMISCLLIFALASASRSFGQYKYFHAPFDVYISLNERITPPEGAKPHTVNVCVGKEWYRYPSSFFLPDNARLQFVKSDFAGLLPKAYPSADPADWASILNVTKAIPTEMNDMNRDEPSRYVDVSECDFLVDLEIPYDNQASKHEPNYSADMEKWNVVKTEPFLISGLSSGLFRAFYVPFLSERHCVFGNYSLLERKR